MKTSVSVSQLPSLPLRAKQRLPRQPGIYYVYAKQRLLYVGMSSNLYFRWNSDRYGPHHRLADIQQARGDRIHYRVIRASERQLLYIEACEIQRLNPALNYDRPNPNQFLARAPQQWQFAWGNVQELVVQLLAAACLFWAVRVLLNQ